MLRTITALVRTPALRIRTLGTLPEHAPGQSENEAWLDSLDDTVSDGIDQYPHEFETQSQQSDSELASTPYRIMNHKDRGVWDIALQYSLADLRSSHFASMKTKSSPKAEKQVFADVRVIRVRSGKGGDGSVSFFRDAGRAVGPPDGGDGGHGGDIYVQAIEGLTSLNKLKQTYLAMDGKNGQARQLDGRNGDDVVITVPVGTVIKWVPEPKDLREKLTTGDAEVEIEAKSGLSGLEPMLLQLRRDSYTEGEGWIFKDKDKDEDWHRAKDHFIDLNKKVSRYDAKIIAEEEQGDLFPIHGLDLSKPMEKPMMLLRGGQGGLGNMHFLTNVIRNPRFAKRGRSHLEAHFLFELKLLADLGLVGLPNAGKSTLLRAISNARPRVGHWEFTTLQPTVGTIGLGVDKPSFTVADIPGIIKGASENRGMGVEFLRHIERSGGLVFVISLESQDPIHDLGILLNELGDKRTKGKKILIAATKADVDGSREKFRYLKRHTDENGWKIVPVCAMQKENIEQLILMMGECAGKI